MKNTNQKNKQFSFEISLSVLNHLGRNLYRSFATVLGEAISNSWDANAQNVWIYINKGKDSFYVKDDGMGMSADDFQNKFLKIGYSKRRGGRRFSPGKKRPYIGRKGIGKLALLSCAEKISLISKPKGGNYVGGVIDNSGLDRAITQDLTPQQYPLGKYKAGVFKKYTQDHKQGTIIHFEKVKDGIRNRADFLKKIIALYFRFSLLDKSFDIFIDDEKISHKHLKELVEKTQFLWKINKHKDPLVESIEERFTKEDNELRRLRLKTPIKGFIASVEKPRHLKIITTEEKTGVDLFVNGRLRERDILKHIPTARVTESYLYGQIHYDDLDDKTDRFTSSREGIVADDAKFNKFLADFKKHVLSAVIEDWDEWRRKHRQDGDSENERLSPKQRKSSELYNAVSREYSLSKNSANKKMIDEWVNDLSEDAQYNFGSFAECFISENLVRKFIKEKNIPLSKEAEEESKQWKNRETESKETGNISIEIRRIKSDLSYLSMDGLAALADKKDRIKDANLFRDAKEYKPIRDAIAHTALLTDVAKQKLTTVYENIKGRIKKLLS